MDGNIYYESVRFYIVESAKIKHELSIHQTEYFPEKVRELIGAYKFTISKAIEHGNLYLKSGDTDEDGIRKTKEVIEKYQQLLDKL